MTSEAKFRILWPAGLALFALTVWLSLPLAIDGVPGGILAHQAAGTAQRVEAIQQAWTAAGLYGQARIAMVSDIVFITVYGLGAWYGGLALMDHPAPRLRRLGMLLVAAAAIYIMADYAETFAELVQLLQQRGSEHLAWLAAHARPVKVVAWPVTFLAVLAGLVLRRRAASA